MTDLEVLAWLDEEYRKPFEGWDFSYLAERRQSLGVLPWDYQATAAHYLPHSTSLLDIDTGGGEILSTLLEELEFKGRACAVEAYPPNVSIARKRLKTFGVEVRDTSEQAACFADESFDLVLDRHGGSVTPQDTFRILESGGCLVTEQIGDRTNAELRELFHAERESGNAWPPNAEDAAHLFAQIGFETERLEEYSCPVRFADVGAIVYYLKAVPWEVPGFSVSKHADALVRLHRESGERGFAIDATYHAYLLVARKP